MLMSGKQAFCGEGEYTTLYAVREARLQKKSEKFVSLRIIKVFNIGSLTREGEWILYNSPIEKSTF